MFSVLPNTFVPALQLTHLISESSFTERNVRYFDNDGFELTGLETIYYEEHGIDFVHNGILNHKCDQRPWLTGHRGNFILDHSMILQRWEFTYEARNQLLQHKRRFPQLMKYLNIIPKWGIDFALEYYDNDEAIEIIHIENDYRSYQQAMEAKTTFEKKIMETDWVDFSDRVIKNKEKWTGLTGFAQNDWKAQYWGLPKAEIIEKAFL